MESLLFSLLTPLLSDVRISRNSDHAKQVVSHSTPPKYLVLLGGSAKGEGTTSIRERRQPAVGRKWGRKEGAAGPEHCAQERRQGKRQRCSLSRSLSLSSQYNITLSLLDRRTDGLSTRVRSDTHWWWEELQHGDDKFHGKAAAAGRDKHVSLMLLQVLLSFNSIFH